MTGEWWQRRILVTGGAGFIGSHLVRRLLATGDEVLVVDNFYSGSRDNLADVLSHPRLEIMRHDVTFPLYVEVDEIYHLACPASPVFYQRDPVQTTKTSVMGSINMLGLAKRTKAKILLSSTSEVYGDPVVHPQQETYWGNVNPIGIRSCYDEGKRCAETLFFDYRRQHDMPIKVARIFNTYGPGMRPDDGRVVSNFIVSALTGEPLTVYGDGSQTRSFCYVDDLVEGLIRLMGTAARGDRADQHRQPERVHHARAGRPRHRRSSGTTPGSSTGRCPPTTRRSVSPTSARLARSSIGNPRCSSARGWPRRWSTSGRSRRTGRAGHGMVRCVGTRSGRRRALPWGRGHTGLSRDSMQRGRVR